MEDQNQNTVPVEMALERISALSFPMVQVSDIAWMDGHRFIYQQSGWISHPAEEEAN